MSAASQATFVLTPVAGGPSTDTSVMVNGPINRDFSVDVDGLTPSTGYTFVVQFKDGAGNVLGSSSSVAPANCPFTTLQAAPAIDVIKFVNGEDADVPTGPFVQPSSTLLFRYEITNTGNTVLNDVTLTDDKLGAILSCPRTTLQMLPDPLARMTCTATGPAPTAGQYTNLATVIGHVAGERDGDRHEPGERVRCGCRTSTS